MSAKYFAYLNWKMINDGKRYAIVAYEDAERLLGSKVRYELSDHKILFERASGTFQYGAVIVESTGCHHLVVSHQPITLAKVIQGNYYRKIYDEFEEVENRDPLRQKLFEIKKKRQNQKTKGFEYRRTHTSRFNLLRHFDGVEERIDSEQYDQLSG